MLKQLLPSENIRLNVEVLDWEDAVRKAGAVLYENKFIHSDYIDLMVETVKQLGPYIVIGKGIALPHARVGKAVLRTGISFIRLKNPVYFGNPDNDPVDLVFALAAANNDSHIMALGELSALLCDENSQHILRTAQSAIHIAELFEKGL